MENEIEKEIVLLNTWKQQICQHIKEISDFIKKLNSISYEYIKSKKEIQQSVYNVFNIISDLYYRENFHSDIIRFFLDPNEMHNCGSAFLDLFIQMLNKNIDARDYNNAVVVREEGRIDILIKSEMARKCIIIENKIHNASDMPRQIPRYYDYVKKQGYNIDAIVYLPLEKTKEPDKSDWTDEDKENITPLLTIIPAYDKSKNINLVDNWLRPSILISDNIDIISTLRQYSSLIKKLNHNIMDNIVLEKFRQELLKDDNAIIAKSIQEMLNSLPRYLAMRIVDRYRDKCHPFEQVGIYGGADAYFAEAMINNVGYKFDIWCDINGYHTIFWHNREDVTEDDFKNLVKSIDTLSKSGFIIDKLRAKKDFNLTEEEKLYELVDELLNELKEKTSC